MRRIHKTFCLAFGLAMASPLGAQTAPEPVANALVETAGIPAAVVGRVTADSLDFAVAGVRVEGGARAEPDDVWHVGSITKSMTATLAARMVEAGLIAWDDTIGALLGAEVPGMYDDWRDMPLHLLLTHGSGMDANLTTLDAMMFGDGSRAEYVAAMLADAPVQERGGFLYSNAGYVVAGAMLEAAGGAPWEDLIARHVFAPLDLASAGFGPPQGAAIEGHRPRLLRGLQAAGQEPEADNISALGPAGRVHLNAEDMLRYLRAHLVRDETFLSAESWDRLHRPEGPEAYAMGWGVGEDGSLVHSGSNTFWYAVAYIDVARGEALFAAVNSGDLAEVVEPVDRALREMLSRPPN